MKMTLPPLPNPGRARARGRGGGLWGLAFRARRGVRRAAGARQAALRTLGRPGLGGGPGAAGAHVTVSSVESSQGSWTLVILKYIHRDL